MRRWIFLFFVLFMPFFIACGGGSDSGPGDSASNTGGGTADGGPVSGSEPDGSPQQEPTTPVKSEWTYTLSESTPGLTVWTTPCTNKIRTADVQAPQGVSASGVTVYAARNEFEPFQLVLPPAAGNLTLFYEGFTALGGAGRFEANLAQYNEQWEDGLVPLSSGDTVPRQAQAPTVLWFTVYVPATAAAGQHTATVTLISESEEIIIPVKLTVFDFTLPDELHFATQLQVDIAALHPAAGNAQEKNDAVKSMLHEHRITPASVNWPSGFKPSITWTDPSQTAIDDEPYEPAPYSIGALSRRYMLGEGWEKPGFADSLLFQFENNSTPRPDAIAGIGRGADHYGTPAYNAQWQSYLYALQTYLADHGMLSKGYYYVMNEPQDQTDYDLAAYLCRLTRQAAGNLRIAISEEPRPEIAENTGGACGYDIWIAEIQHYKREYAWKRQVQHNEQVWFYSLDNDPPPFPNPTSARLQGMNQRILPWIAWHHRISGWVYYDGNRFFTDQRPNIRAELLREGFEDYEYLFLANRKSAPSVSETHPVDATVASVTSGMTSWTREVDALMTLRTQLGRYIVGDLAEAPLLQVETTTDSRSWYINFQDPQGQPTDDPLVVEGRTYTKVGWEAYNADRGWGWIANTSGVPMTGFAGDADDRFNALEKSFVYDDYGRRHVFEIDVANGTYQVIFGAGNPRRGYPNDPHDARAEGIVLIDNAITTDENPTIRAEGTVTVRDGRFTLEIGAERNDAYTFAAYLILIPN